MAEPVVDTTVTPVDTDTNVDPNENGGITPDPSPGTEADASTDGSSASSNTPFDQDPKWKAARAAQKSLDGLLADNEFNSIEDLITALERGSGLEDNLSGRDLDAIIEKAETLEKYEAHWAEQERLKRDEGESSEDTIARLKRENQELVDNADVDKSRWQEAKDTETSIRTFNSEVTTLVGQQDLPTEYREFANLLLGADNPMMDVDPTDKRAFSQAASGMLDKVKAFEKAVVARHKAGKIDIPATPPSNGGEQPAPVEQKVVIKNLKHAHQVALERLTAARK